ncbi:hypothetical protein AAG906_018969 [Vitis piasezkii]
MIGENSFSSLLENSPSMEKFVLGVFAQYLSIKLDDNNFLIWKQQVGVLHNTKKGDLLVNDYLLKIKSLVDQLTSVGDVLATKDHIDAIFYGLSSEYDTFVVLVNSRNDLYTVAKIESMLLAQETLQMSTRMVAMVATSNVVIDNCWYPNFGVTNHCTPDPNNFIIQDTYARNYQIHMGDGTGFAIQHIVVNGLYVFDSSSIPLKPQSLKSSLAYHVPCFPINPKCMYVQVATTTSNVSSDPIFQLWHNKDVQFNEKSFLFSKTKSITSLFIPSSTPTSHSALIPIHSSILFVPSPSTSFITNTIVDQSNSN